MKNTFIIFTSILLAFIFASCAPQKEITSTPTSTSTEQLISQSYPEPIAESASSNKQQESYPKPEIVQPAIRPTIQPVAFRLNKPCFEGAEIIKGSGLPNVPIIIVDTTSMGEILGNGNIDSDGNFEIQVPPLEKNHRIGIILGNLVGTPWTEADFYAESFSGSEARQIPLLGFYFDTTLVIEE